MGPLCLGNCKSLGRASREEIFTSYGNDLERQEDSSAFLSVGVEGWGPHSSSSASAVEVQDLISRSASRWKGQEAGPQLPPAA